MFYEKKIDVRSRQTMVDFLTRHFRYNTMNSCNGLTSYANKIKLHNLGLTKEQEGNAWEMFDTDFWDKISFPIDVFTREMHGSFSICSNGRSGGYLVLMNSSYKPLNHKSFCRSCGQQNFTEATVGNNTCGRCHAEGNTGRVNYGLQQYRLEISSKGIDDREDFDKDEWSMSQLRDRVKLVQRFDRACDEIRSNFIDLINDCEVVEKTIMVPKTRKVLKCSCNAGIR